jgi:MerR family redox-sensitive transcriptional activator SoxR
MRDGLLPIDKIAKSSGVASSALRYYERCGLINEGVKIAGRRHYPPAILQRLSVIKVCQRIGFTLAEITQLLAGGQDETLSWREVAMARRDEVKRQIGRLQNLVEVLDTAMDCPCHELGECPHMAPDGEIASRSDDCAEAALPTWQQSPVG